MQVNLVFRAPSDREKHGTVHLVWRDGPEAWDRGHLVLTYRDLEDLARGATVTDIYTVIRSDMRGVRATDLGEVEGSPRAHGSGTVRWVTIPIPPQALKAIRRLALHAWRAQREALDTLEAKGAGWAECSALQSVEIDLAPYLARWERDYGQGIGGVEVVMDDRTATMLDAARAMGGNLADMLERLETIARNGTCARWERETLRLYRDAYRDDDPCFTFRTRGLFGGLVNHAKQGAPGDWSLHT